MSRRIYLAADGMRISKAGRDALSGNTYDQLVDTTKRNSRTFMAGRMQGSGVYSGDYSSGYGIYRVAVTHGLGYVPQCFTNYVGQSVIDVIVNSAQIIAQCYLLYGKGNQPPATSPLPGYVDYAIFYDRWV